MQLFIIFQFLLTVLSFVLVCMAAANWSKPKMLWFFVFALATFIISASYTMSFFANDHTFALLAEKLKFFGFPYLGVSSYFYCREFSERPIENFNTKFTLLIPPVITTILAIFYPYSDILIHRTIYNTENNTLTVTYGIAYYLLHLYNVVLCGMAAYIITVYLKKISDWKTSNVVSIVSVLVTAIIAGILQAIDVFPSHIDVFAVSIVFVMLVFTIFFNRFRQTHLRSLGRWIVLENMKDAYILLDNKNNYVDANDVAINYFPQLDKKNIGINVKNIENFPYVMTATESTEATLFSLEIDGETKFLHMSQTALYQAGHFVGKSIMIYDDTKNYKLTEELRNLATSDPLTGLLNRRTFFERAEHDFDLARRDKRTGCAMMCDIDHFKKVNDTYGHACGDEVIINVTKYIANRLRHTDLCGRYGGEEFVLWLPSTPPANAEYVAESIRSGIESLEIKHDKYTIKITISIGIAPMKEGIPDKLDTVINNADFALYQAKNNGRNQVVMFDEPDADIQKLDEADYMVWGM